MSVLEKLTEGIVERSLQQEGAALMEKWERTGLLEGLGTDATRNSMARLLENQAAQLLKEATSMSGGQVEGFASVAFPIVRRVFGGLLANDLVSVQPMSLPSGLIFFMDFTYSADTAYGQFGAGQSLYGGDRVGQQLTGGVDLDGVTGGSSAIGVPGERSFYNLNNGYSSPTGSLTLATAFTAIASGTVGDTVGGGGAVPGSITLASGKKTDLNKLVRYDPELSGTQVCVLTANGATMAALSPPSAVGGQSRWSQLNMANLAAINWETEIGDVTADGTNEDQTRLLRRLTDAVDRNSSRRDLPATALQPESGDTDFIFVVARTTGSVVYSDGANVDDLDNFTARQVAANTRIDFPLVDNFSGTPAAGTSNALGAVVGTDAWGLENRTNIPEIDIKVDSVSVTAVTKKLKAKWTPELGQDLNAYHNLDAEVELTQILSEQIALEIDREILNDLIQGAAAGTYYWSRSPGLFVNKVTGAELGAAAAAPDFTGTVSEWYETLIETINDVSAQIHRKTLRGGANFLVTSPEVANILEFTAGFRANITHDDDRGVVGAVNVGSISKKFDVYVDPYFPRNVVLVGRKGGSFLESGYVYAPYVPLQVTPTIFGTEDFVPRKGVMTRYAKKMVRPDMYGLVICRGLLGESGATG